jgi:EAL domain-containing protein (putative c-di-GMP-specific phosphodiesterase class I)
MINARPVQTTVSVGLALSPDHGSTIEELVTHGGAALDEAKRQGVGGVAVFDPGRQGEALSASRLLWKRRIHEALEEDRFVLYGQPVVELATGRVQEYELLLRLQDAEGGLVPPAEFLPVAERFGLIQLIDRWVLRQAIALIAERQRAGQAVRLAANVSGRSVADAELLQTVRQGLHRTGIDPAALVIEITETAAIAEMGRALEFVESLKALGCRFALDDFGAGFSSFRQIRDLPVDYLKIDGSFIRDLAESPVDQGLVRAIAELARGLGKQTIAEYVEDNETAALLRELGVDFGQGNYLGQAAPAADLGERPDRAVKAA